MPDYAPSATPRYVVTYFVARHQHTLTIRGRRDESQTATEDRAKDIAAALFTYLSGVLCDDFVWVSALYIPQDTEVSVISSLPAAITGAVAVASFSKQDSITSLGLAGKGAGGSKVSFKLYGFNWTLDVTTPNGQEDFLLTAADNENMADMITALNGIGVIAIDNSVATFYYRGTIKTNDHWLRLVRRGFA